MQTAQKVRIGQQRRPSYLLARLFRTSPVKVRKATWGYIFLLPWLLGFIIFTGGPVVASLFFSFTQFNSIDPPKFIGLANFRKAFFGDDLFWSSLGRTFYYACATVPVGLVGSLLLAMLLNQKLAGTNIFRTLFFMPHLIPTVAAAVLWIWILHPIIGPLNNMLRVLHLPHTIGWLVDRNWAIPSLIMISLWSGMGGNRMIIFLAGLQGVPQEMYDSAAIDGAGRWARFRHITLPLISPTVFFNLVLGIIGALKVFSMAYVATRGGPERATWFYALHIYQNAFEYMRMGYGSALAWIFAVVVITLTYIQLRTSRRWVYYAGE